MDFAQDWVESLMPGERGESACSPDSSAMMLIAVSVAILEGKDAEML
ncbi:hypothetical protein [Bifidobacterium lemurum]|nr:hypothetical protein [Bifidobacterium lemurum]